MTTISTYRRRELSAQTIREMEAGARKIAENSPEPFDENKCNRRIALAIWIAEGRVWLDLNKIPNSPYLVCVDGRVWLDLNKIPNPPYLVCGDERFDWYRAVEEEETFARIALAVNFGGGRNEG